jgi:predicted CopG family antitoxin
MSRELTITLADDVYEGLQERVGAEQISSFIERLLRPYLMTDEELEAEYREMAADLEAEREAMEWIEDRPDECLD